MTQVLLELLRKEPDERYQSAEGLCADLGALVEIADQPERLREFQLGHVSRPDRPRFARALFGREEEQATLRRALDEISAGHARCVVVRGPTGIGKSTLVDSLRQGNVGDGYLIAGRFERELQRSYSGWAGALESLTQQILVEDDARLGRWRAALRDGLGRIAGAWLDLVPDLDLVLGDVAAVPPLGPAETRARLTLALQRLLRVCATPEHPLVLFLDDLHWCDSDSLALLESVLASPDPGAMLFVGAYRDEDGDATRALDDLLVRLTGAGVEVRRIDLQPLRLEDSADMLAAALGGAPGELRPLAAEVQRKTGNHPLLVERFVEQLHVDGLLRFSGGRWCWALSEVSAAAMPEDAVAWMARKIEVLAPSSLRVVQLASCAGDEFDVDGLVDLSAGERDEIHAAVDDLLRSGLLVPCSAGFRFAHERIREAARELVSDAERARLHADTGTRLLAGSPEPDGSALFEIADHLNQGLDLLGEDLRVRLLELDVKAGQQALASGAPARALTFLVPARSLFREEDWSRRRPLGLQLGLLAADSAFQVGDLGETTRVLDDLDRRSPDEIAFARIAAKRIQVLALRASPLEGVEHARLALLHLGVRRPRRPSGLRARLELRRVRRRMRRAVFEIPRTPMPSRIVAAQLVGAASAALLMRANVRLGTWSLCYAMRASLRYGYMHEQAYLISTYAYHVHLILGDSAECRRAAALSARWLRDHPTSPAADLLEHTLNLFVQPWLLRRAQALAPVSEMVERFLERGKAEYAYYASFLDTAFRALAGEATAPTLARLDALARSVRTQGQWYREPADCHAVYSLLVQREVDGEQLERRLRESEQHLAETGSVGVFTRTFWVLVLCVHGRFEAACAASDALGDDLLRVTPMVQIMDHLCLRGLAYGALAQKARGPRRQRCRRELRRCLERIRRWGQAGPDFAHMALLLEAEQGRCRGRALEAQGLYQKAARVAKEQRFLHHAALAHERRASLLREGGRNTQAREALLAAIGHYGQWGAPAKVSALGRILLELPDWRAP